MVPFALGAGTEEEPDHGVLAVEGLLDGQVDQAQGGPERPQPEQHRGRVAAAPVLVQRGGGTELGQQPFPLPIAAAAAAASRATLRPSSVPRGQAPPPKLLLGLSSVEGVAPTPVGEEVRQRPPSPPRPLQDDGEGPPEGRGTVDEGGLLSVAVLDEGCQGQPGA